MSLTNGVSGKKGYQITYVAVVNIRTKEVLALDVTDEKVHMMV
jgi:hypothetical protein